MTPSQHKQRKHLYQEMVRHALLEKIPFHQPLIRRPLIEQPPPTLFAAPVCEPRPSLQAQRLPYIVGVALPPKIAAHKALP